MRRLKTRKIIALGVLVITMAAQSAFGQAETGNKYFERQIAPLFKGMGYHGLESTSDTNLVDVYFNQAIALTYGFNHLEAERSFKQMAVLDPHAAMSYWGQALVQGPNINAAMEASAAGPAYQAIQRAIELKKSATPKERDLIDALAERYSEDETLSDRAELDQAYARAMKKLVDKYPDDPTIRTLLAEALMIIHAWDYWHGDGRPKEWTPEILEVLETGLADYPNHTGLIHYYIHAVEASKAPGRALKYADTLRNLVPGSGHLVHMPSHIYIRTGLYQEGVEANEKAILVDADYITQCRQQGIYPLAYVPHNRHFLWAMATMQGNSKKAITAAEHMARHVDPEKMKIPGLETLQHYWVTPMYAYVRFGKWEKILSLSRPDSLLKYPSGVWHYARGIAFTATGELDKAWEELFALKKLLLDETLKEVTIWEINNAYDVLTIAVLTLEGEIEGALKNFDRAITLLKEAVGLEDELNYNEPSDWHYPVRQSLGDILLKAGRSPEAERIYLEDLQVFPENGWSLFGLYKSYVCQRKMDEANAVKERLRRAWRWADIELTASRVI